MSALDRGTLVDAFRAGAISRRAFIRRATAAGISAGAATMLANRVGAQEATPAASRAISITGAAEPGGRSINREEYHALIRQTFDLDAPAVTGGQVIYGASADIDTLHPQLFGDVLTGYVIGAIYQWLVDINPTNGFPAPGLADYWELADDGVTYTFHLNPNATWHDGEPVTTEDVVFSFDSALDESSLTGFQSSIGRVLESYRAVDGHTFELVARDRLAVFIENTALLVGIVPKHIWESVPPSGWGSDPGSTGQDPARVVGSGPFRFVEWIAGDHVTVERNDDYWDPDAIPTIDEFIYRVVPESSSATAALTTGEVDIARAPFGDVVSLEEDPNVDIVVHDDTGSLVLNMNQDPDKTGLFVDIPVRQALMYAIDRQLIAEEIFFGYASQANGTQPPLSIAYDETRVNTIYTYDPEKARHLLEEAGWIEGDDGIREKDGIRLSFECLFADNVSARRQALTYMQQAWGEVGIDMQPVDLPFTTFFDALDSGDYETALHGLGFGADGSQGHFFRCDAVPPADINWMHYCNERYDELDDLQIAELDVEKRIDLLIEASNIVNDEVAAGVLLFQQAVWGSRATLHNFLPTAYGYFWSMPWWWTELR